MFEDAAATAGAKDQSIDMFRGENLRKMALQNLRERRQR